METNVVKKRGRPSVLGNSTQVVKILRDVASGKRPSYYLSHQLVEAGYMKFDSKKSEGRGRPKLIPLLTKEGANFLAEQEKS